MVVRKGRKARKLRGSGTYGWGNKKKHRGSGSKGGKGFAGSLWANKFYVQINFPGHIGKKGFGRPWKTYRENNTINLVNLGSIKGEDIDLTSLGYDKLLGKGSVGRAITIKVRAASKQAIEKIKKAGGKVLLPEAI